jgi:hypothetical protein
MVHGCMRCSRMTEALTGLTPGFPATIGQFGR